MSKKRYLISALAIAACSAGALTLPATPAWADADEESSLAPLVMILFDTSGSMDYCFETDKGTHPVNAEGKEVELYCNQFKTNQKKKLFSEEDRNPQSYLGLMSAYLPSDDPDYKHSKIVVTDEESGDSSEFYYTNDQCDGAWNTPWVGCHTDPILGYEGIREGCVHTRLTKAIAQLAGSAKTLEGRSNMLVKANEQKPAREAYDCSGSTCEYVFSDETDPRYQKKQYLYDCETSPDEFCSEESKEHGGYHCFENDYYYCVSAIQTLGDNSKKDLSDYGSHKEYYDELRNSPTYFQDIVNAYNDDGIIQSYGSRVKFGFAGFDYTGKPEFLYTDGNASQKYKKVPNNNGDAKGFGISNDNPESQAPLLYPTVEDEPDKILERNNAVAYSVRGYWAGGGTPIGPALADINYILTDDPKCKRQDVKEGSGKRTVTDHHFSCRDKAVILITDGAPSKNYGVSDAGAKGQGARVWEDAERLYKSGIKLYVVGYSLSSINPRHQPAGDEEGNLENACVNNVDQCMLDVDTSTKREKYDTPNSLDKFAGDILNRLAWKGGTCINPLSGEFVDPDDADAYKKLLSQCDGKTDEDGYADCQCFYNAKTGDGLKSALVTVLSDMLSGFYSKTKVATTTAIGYKNNFKQLPGNTEKTLLAGYYNVYSGYRIGKGAMTEAKLERTAVVCNPETGYLEFDESQHLDLAAKLKDRIKSCAKSVDEIDEFRDNDCDDERLIFSGKYSHFYQYPPISKFKREGNVTVDEIDTSYPPYTKNMNDVGILPRVVIGNKEFGDIYGFVKNTVDNGIITACSDLQHMGYDEGKSVPVDYINPNYILSPYECVTNVDCGMDGKHSKHCDLGRCIPYSNYEKYRKENACDNPGFSYITKTQHHGFYGVDNETNYVCIDGLLRDNPKECNAHRCGDNSPYNCRGCGEGEVCHAGMCVAGTPTDGSDVKQFLASQLLGPIEFASPLVVPPPNRAFNSEDYIKFHNDYWTRDTMLMVGANDAMLHAFVLGDNMQSDEYEGCDPGCTKELYNLPEAMKGVEDFPKNLKFNSDTKEGDELWAFVPKLMLSKLSTLVTKFSSSDKVTFYGVNSTPVYADVHLPSGLTINGDYWRTVVVGGFGRGGRGYYALDVTDPGNPFVLWEVDNDPQLSSTSNFTSYVACEALGWSSSYCDAIGTHMLGYSYPEPVITNMVIGDSVEPVVILAGGRNDDNSNVYDTSKINADPTSGSWSKPGHVMYILRLFPRNNSDLFVKSFYFNEKLTGTPVVFPNGFNTTAEKIYVGGEYGSLYRLNVVGNVNSWGVFDKVKDTEPAINSLKAYTKKVPKPIFRVLNENVDKITFAPAVSLYSTYMSEPVIQLAFGTGASDTIVTDSGKFHYVASFLDVPKGNGDYQLNTVSGGILNTFKFLPTIYTFGSEDIEFDSNCPKGDVSNILKITDLEHMTAAPITYNFTTYFATYKTDTSGSSSSQCMSGNANIYRFNNVRDEVILDKLTEGVQNNDKFTVDSVFGTDAGFGQVSRVELDGGQIYGLEISEQIYCAASSDDPSVTGHTYAPQLMFLSNSSDDNIEKFSGTNDNTTSKALAINLDAIKSEVTFSTWASVYE